MNDHRFALNNQNIELMDNLNAKDWISPIE